MKLKATHYKTKYGGIDEELKAEIRELCLIETQQFLLVLWEGNSIREEKVKKTSRQKTTRLRNLLQKEKEKINFGKKDEK